MDYGEIDQAECARKLRMVIVGSEGLPSRSRRSNLRCRSRVAGWGEPA